MMRWCAALKACYAIVCWLHRFRREYEARGAARLSPAAGTRDRRRLERVALDLIDGRDTGWRRWTGLDDAAGEYMAAVLKSSNLDIVLHGTTTIGRQQARQAIIDGANSLTDWQGPAGDRAKV